VTIWTRETAEPRLAELAPLVAKALGEGWKREKREGGEPTHYIALVHGDERVGLHVSYPYGRLNISGSLTHIKDTRGENPYVRGEENPKITASLDRSPEQIARDIKRRVLPGYRAVLACSGAPAPRSQTGSHGDGCRSRAFLQNWRKER
jgi:hypothetical protein